MTKSRQILTPCNGLNIRGDSVAKGPKVLSIKNYVIEIMT